MSFRGKFWLGYLSAIILLIAASVIFNFWRWLIIFWTLGFAVVIKMFINADDNLKQKKED